MIYLVRLIMSISSSSDLHSNSGGTTNKADDSYTNSDTGEVANNSQLSRIFSHHRRIPSDDDDTLCSECGQHIPTEHFVQCDAPLRV
jgi:hypothetical protein